MAVTLQASTCLAQNSEQVKFYKLEFVLKEVEGGKVLNARTYSVTSSSASGKDAACSIRTGSKVPIPMSPNNPAFTYLDVGVSVDCYSITETQNGLSLRVSADVSSILQEGSEPTHPIVRQNKWTGNVILPIKKPTVIFTSDDPASKRQMQFELTVTPLQ